MTEEERNNLTVEEVRAVRMLFDTLVKWSNEDDVGMILYTGAFHFLPDEGAVVRLAHKLRLTTEDEKLKTLLSRQRIQQRKGGGQ